MDEEERLANCPLDARITVPPVCVVIVFPQLLDGLLPDFEEDEDEEEEKEEDGEEGGGVVTGSSFSNWCVCLLMPTFPPWGVVIVFVNSPRMFRAGRAGGGVGLPLPSAEVVGVVGGTAEEGEEEVVCTGISFVYCLVHLSTPTSTPR